MQAKLAFLVCFSLLTASSCAGTSYRAGTYTLDGVRFVLGDLPPEWKKVYGERGLTWRRADTKGTIITVNVSCRRVGDAPLEVLTNHLLFGLTERNFELRELVPYLGREAERTLVSAKLDGVPVRLSTMVLKRNRCIYDAFYAAAPDRFESHRGEFEHMLAGLEVVEERSE
jgi:hypothetical protein